MHPKHPFSQVPPPAPAPALALALGLAALLAGGCPSQSTGPRKPLKQPRLNPKPPPADPGRRKVVRVIDGDTVVLNGGTRVRIHYINTPEIDEEMGDEAREFTKVLVYKRLVNVEGQQKDTYGRLLGDLIVGEKSLAHELVARGLAHVFVIPPVGDPGKVKKLMAAQAEARRSQLGIWDTNRYKGAFHITSFHANARGNDNFNLNGEYVRIANITCQPQPLKGYMLSNKKGDHYEFGEITVPAGHTVRVHSGNGYDQVDPAKQIKLYWGRKRGAWSNKGERATLVDPEGNVIDQVFYDPDQRKNYK